MEISEERSFLYDYYDYMKFLPLVWEKAEKGKSGQNDRTQLLVVYALKV